MSLYVAVFPDLGVHKKWISKIRTEFDPSAREVDPHMTLVFPTDSLSVGELKDEVSNLTKNFTSFSCALRSAIIMPDLLSASKRFHVFRRNLKSS